MYSIAKHAVGEHNTAAPDKCFYKHGDLSVVKRKSLTTPSILLDHSFFHSNVYIRQQNFFPVKRHLEMNVMSASIESILDNVRLCNILICQQSTQSKAQNKSFTSVTVYLPSNLDKLWQPYKTV